VLASALTSIDARGLRYRGHATLELAVASTFEAVAELLWTGVLPRDRPTWAARGLGVRPSALRALLPPAAAPFAVLALAVPALASSQRGPSETLEDELVRARALILRIAALVGAPSDRARAGAALASGSVARALLVSFGVDGGPRAARAVDQALVLLADHELNASTFAVRVAASVGADLGACVSAGVAAASGVLHGTASERVEGVVAEAGSPRGARRVAAALLGRGEAIVGFGHRLYPDGDPRCPPLLETAARLAPRSHALATLRALVDAVRDLGGPPPTVDVGLVALASALGLPRGSAAALFAVGRSAGWVAHALEQREAGFALRPRARYVGP
jgi:citrate synthase